MTTYNFPGRGSGPLPPPPPPYSVSAQIKVSNSLNSHSYDISGTFYIRESLDICIAGPGQFINPLLIISADVKAKTA